jgi:hypothetical protein
VQVAQKKIDVAMNPPDASSAAIDWTATMSGNAYMSVSALNSGQNIYPENFQPNPGRLSVQVTKANAETEAAALESAVSPMPTPAQTGVQSEPN